VGSILPLLSNLSRQKVSILSVRFLLRITKAREEHKTSFFTVMAQINAFECLLKEVLFML